MLLWIYTYSIYMYRNIIMCFVKKGQRTVGSWSKQALGLLPYVKQYELN